MGCCTSQYRLTASTVATRALAKGINLNGRVAVITGCTSGLGVETARVLANNGATVVVTGRNKPKLEKVANALSEGMSMATGGKIIHLVLDLAAFASIEKFVSEFLGLGLPLHYLICNAGIMATDYAETAEGIEAQFGTCHVGHHYLTVLLKDKLVASAPSRVVMLSSTAHEVGAVVPFRIHFDRVPRPEKGRYDRLQAYQQAKLANLIQAHELNRRWKAAGVTAYSLHPGVIKTELFDTIPCACCMFFCCCLKSVPQGSATTLYCTLQADIPDGEYFADSRVVKGETAKVAEGEGEKLWEWTENLIAEKAGRAGAATAVAAGGADSDQKDNKENE